jgi:hypothetical protein
MNTRVPGSRAEPIPAASRGRRHPRRPARRRAAVRPVATDGYELYPGRAPEETYPEFLFRTSVWPGR